MSLSKIVLILFVLNISCLGSNGELTQPSQVQTSFWSYLKYASPLYYWKKYQIRMLEYKIEMIKREKIDELNEEIKQYKADRALLDSITSAKNPVLLREKNFETKFVRGYLSSLSQASDEKNFAIQQHYVIEKLQNIIASLELLKKEGTVNDHEIIDLENQKQELEQQIQDYK